MTTPEEPPPGGAPVTAPDQPAETTAKPRRHRSFWRELPFLIVIALVLALLIKTFLVQAFYIPSASMEPTLNGGPASPGGAARPYDRVLVNKLVYRFRDPRRGEVVVFKKPSYWTAEAAPPPTTGIVHWFQDFESAIGVPVTNTEDIIKRVIGVPGDVVQCTHNGAWKLTVNGHPLSEPYLFPGSNECGPNTFSVKVAPGHLWVMGDNRNNSADSRANPNNPWHGAIPIDNVVGRAFVVIWPHEDWKTLPVPATFHQSGLSSSAAAVSPLGLGLLGALPLTGLRRRWLIRRRRGR